MSLGFMFTGRPRKWNLRGRPSWLNGFFISMGYGEKGYKLRFGEILGTGCHFNFSTMVCFGHTILHPLTVVIGDQNTKPIQLFRKHIHDFSWLKK